MENARLYRLAQNAVRARDDVLGIVAHDLRNPLSGIAMHSQMILRGTLEQDARARVAAERIGARRNE